jgi:DNA-binding NarL/FixJ family response regulator
MGSAAAAQEGRTAPVVLVIDDHPLFRRGLVQMLRDVVGVADIVECATAGDGLACWRRQAFDLVTLDLSLPDGDGFSLLRQARGEGLAGAVVVVSMHDDRAYAARARAEGARGYIVKTASPAATTGCLQAVLAGDATFQWATTPLSAPATVTTAPRTATTTTPAPAEGASPAATTSPTSATSPTPSSAAAWGEGLVSLSAAERRVIVLLGRRLTSRAIAGVLGVSVRTVENHRANIARKLDLRGPHRLLEFALAAAPLLEEPGTTTTTTNVDDDGDPG